MRPDGCSVYSMFRRGRILERGPLGNFREALSSELALQKGGLLSEIAFQLQGHRSGGKKFDFFPSQTDVRTTEKVVLRKTLKIFGPRLALGICDSCRVLET